MTNEVMHARRQARRRGEHVDPVDLATVARVDVRTLREPKAAARTSLASVGVPKPGEVLFTLTAGQWSLLDLIRACLDATGPAAVRLSTWTTGVRDAENAAWLLTTGAMTSLQVFTDSGFPAREPDYTARVVALWGLDSIIVTETHAKVATIRAPGWTLAIESSMNLNRNPRYENATIAHVEAVADLYDGWFDDLARTGHRLDAPREEVRAAFGREAGATFDGPQTRAPETQGEKLARLRAERRGG